MKPGGGGASQLQRPTVYAARRLRREMTLPEVLLWQQLRRRPAGLKFRRQHPVEPYVVDFYCREAGLAIEIDGSAHDDPAQSRRDEARDARLRECGLRVLRIPAGEVLRDAAAVVEWIQERAGSPLHQPSPSATAGPPPRAGEE
ncbi:MAG TPA: endonuclease domain-containing protein [Allosphingosinicella sp.]|nr:endonuclease domain-containing protein [Allosphingosinicella sp.]